METAGTATEEREREGGGVTDDATYSEMRLELLAVLFLVVECRMKPVRDVMLLDRWRASMLVEPACSKLCDRE